MKEIEPIYEDPDSEPGLIINWDVSEIDPTTIFPKDCRYYNGGAVAPQWLQDLWNQGEDEEEY